MQYQNKDSILKWKSSMFIWYSDNLLNIIDVFIIRLNKIKMSMNLVEKGFAVFCIGASVLFMAKSYFSGPKVEKHNAYKVRQ